MSTGGDDSVPELPPDSPGSSVSTRLMDEYEELLKHAVVVPNYDPTKIPRKLMDVRDSFPHPEREKLITVEAQQESDAESDVTPVAVKVTRETGLPDFGQSPITSRHSSKQSRNTSDVETPRNKEYESDKSTDRVPPPLFQMKFSSDGSQQEVRHSRSEEEVETIYTTTIDPDVSKMENLLDQWTLDLKRNVLAEFSQSKIRIVELGRQQLIKEQERFASEKTQLLNELESMKELLHTYEMSIERKDQVISNLTHALQKQKEKQDVLKSFNEWKLKHNDMKREAFASQLAYKHYERQLTQKVWDSWHSTIVNKWRQRVEKACQSKAQEICMQLTNDYENKVAAANEALEQAREEIGRLHKERDRYEEAMKKAFMRGVCALNLEAMTMFHPGEEQAGPSKGQSSGEFSDNLESSLPEKDFSAPKTIPQEPIFTSQTRHEAPPPKVVTSQGARSSTISSMAQSKANASSKSSAHKTKIITTRISAKTDTGRHGSGLGGSSLAPPMSSVIVERHQPVNKESEVGPCCPSDETVKTEVPCHTNYRTSHSGAVPKENINARGGGGNRSSQDSRTDGCSGNIT